MSYVDSSPPSYSSAAARLAYTDSLCGGVRLCDRDAFSDSGACPKMLNMRKADGVLKTRFGQTRLFEEHNISGELHSYTKTAFIGKTVIHAGSCLYALSAEESEPRLLYSQMPDKHSVMVEFSGKLYVYCDLRVYSVDREFTAVEEAAYAPRIYENLAVGSKSVYKSNRTANALNMVSPRIEVSYKTGTSRNHYFPVARDVSQSVEVYNQGVLMDESQYTLYDDHILIRYNVDVENDNDIVIRYYVSDFETLGFKDVMSEMTLGISYGGTAISGTRLFFAGNPDCPGKYYISSLLDPLRVDSESFEVIGNSGECITGFMKQYGNLMIFTDRAVLKMSYTMSDLEPVFSVKELNGSLGCDMPGSIQLIDNRVVFANSAKGIFIIDSTENFDEQNIKPISENISRGEGLGFFDRTSDELKGACSADFERRYYLCAGDKMYVWDYNETAYSDSGNYSKAQKRLVWYIYDGICADCLFECGNELCAYFMSGTEGVFSAFRDTGLDFGKRIDVCFESGDVNFSNPTSLKEVKSVYAELVNSENREVYFTARSDAGVYFRKKLSVRRSGDYQGAGLNLPHTKTRRFSFGIDASGKIGLKSVTLSYIMSDGKI